jgi:hypothetical protein
MGMLLNHDVEQLLASSGKGETMNLQLSFKTAICAEYERLLHECQRSLENWRRRREEVGEAHLRGKEIGDELQRLQANYAKAYSKLNKHDKRCELCRFVSKISGREPVTTLSHPLDKNHANCVAITHLNSKRS